MELPNVPDNLNLLYLGGGVVISLLSLILFILYSRKNKPPAFEQLSHSSHLLGDDRKPAGKRRKPKEKRSTSNGNATFANNEQEDSKTKKQTNDKSPNKTVNKKKQEQSPSKKDNKKSEEQKKVKKQENQKKDNKQENQKKDNKQENQKKDNKQENQKKDNKQEQNNNKNKKQDRVVEAKNKKNERNLAKLREQEDKPIDYDEGEWEQAYSRKDKKKKKDDPSKIKTPIQLFLTEEKEKEICVEKQVIKEEVKPAIVEESTKGNNQTPKSKKSKSAKKPQTTEKSSPNLSNTSKPTDSEKPIAKPEKEIAQPKPTIIAPSIPEIEKVVEVTKIPQVSKAPVIEVEGTTPGVAFDELGEMWKEATPARKTKKKTRKE